MNWQS